MAGTELKAPVSHGWRFDCGQNRCVSLVGKQYSSGCNFQDRVTSNFVHFSYRRQTIRVKWQPHNSLQSPEKIIPQSQTTRAPHSVAKHTSRHITCLPALILPYYCDAHLMGKDLLDRSCRAVCLTLSLSSGTSLCVCSFNEFVKTGSSEGFRRLRRLKLSCDWLRIYNSDNSRINGDSDELWIFMVSWVADSLC